MPAKFKNGATGADFPGGDGVVMDIDVKYIAGEVEITGTISNIGDYTWGTSFSAIFDAELKINGTTHPLTVNSSTGAVSSNKHAASVGDVVRVYFVVYQRITNSDWDNPQTTCWTQITQTLAAGDSTTNYLTPGSLPEWDTRFGWANGNGDFTVETKMVTNAPGGLSIDVETDLTGAGSNDRSTSMSVSSSAWQKHTAKFDESGSSGRSVILWFNQDYGNGIEQNQGFKFLTPGDIPALPSSGALLQQREVSGHLSIDGL